MRRVEPTTPEGDALITDAVIGERIRDARLAAGFETGTAFAKKLGISQPILSRIELGQRRVSASELAQIAVLVGRSPTDFLAEGAGRVFYRRETTEDLSQECQSAFEWLRGFAERFEALREYSPDLGLPKAYAIPVSAPDTIGDAQRAAFEVRQFLGLGSAPAPDMFALLERVGCAVLTHEFGSNEFEAMYVPQPIGAVLLNGSKPGVRQRFTLGHELGHHLFHGDGVVVDTDLWKGTWQLDRIANAFAAHFLMPRQGIEIELARRFGVSQPTGAEHAYWLAYHFGVSLEAICFQMQNLDLASARAAGQWRRADRRALASMLELVANDQYHRVATRWPPEFMQRLGYLWNAGILGEQELAAHLEDPRGTSDAEMVRAIATESREREGELVTAG